MRLYALDQEVLLLSPNAEEILKAYTTNTPESARSAFVDRQGRIVAVCAQALVRPGEALLALERCAVERLRGHLAPYLDLAGARLETTRLRAYHDLDGDAAAGAGEYRIPLAQGALLLSEAPRPAQVSAEEYLLFRLRHGLAVQGIDYDREMVLNVHGQEHVSFTKGCYLGQEVVARVHYLRRPPRRLLVKDEASCTPQQRAQMTSKVLDPATRRVIGFVFEETKDPA